jgi:hypothetical protein
VTRRAWIVLALGVALAAVTAGAFARAGHSEFTSETRPGWGMFTPADWKTLSLGLERRGFDAASIHLVDVTDTTRGRRFGLIAGRSRTGATCVTPVTGTTLGATVCRLTKPLVLFTAPQTWKVGAAFGTPAHVMHATAVLGIARHDVAGIVVRDSLDHPTGVTLIRTGPFLTFASGFADPSSLSVYDAKPRLLEHLVLRAP